MKFSEIKNKIQNLGKYKSLQEIKDDNLRICKNSATGDYWLIEDEFLKPVIKSPRECKVINATRNKLRYSVLLCDKSKRLMKNYKIINYIEWGEYYKPVSGKKYPERPTCKTRKYWWTLEAQETAFCSYPMINNNRLIFVKNQTILNDANLVGVYPQNSENNDKMLLFLNSTVNMLNMELFGISNLGEGAIKQNPIYIKNYSLILKPELLQLNNNEQSFYDRNINSIFEELGVDPAKVINAQDINVKDDRRRIDNKVFDVLNLSKAERERVYYSVAELVKNRLEKVDNV